MPMCKKRYLRGTSSVGIDDSDQATLQSRRFARNRSIRMSLLTSVVARMSGVLLQVVSLPIAATQLGPAGFSIYAMLGSLLAAMTLSNLGISQATTLHMARALAAGEVRTGRELFLASLGSVGVMASGVTVLAVLLIVFTPLIPFVFSQHIAERHAPIMPALFVCTVFLATQFLSVFEAAQLAQQRQHRLNIATGMGTFVAAGAVWFVAGTRPGVLSILFAVHLPVIIARVLNAIGVWSEIAPHLRDLVAARKHIRGILMDGLRFVSGTTLANFLCHPFSVLAVGFFTVPLSTASYAAVMNAVILSSSVNSLIVTPFRSAIPEALRTGDHLWLSKAVLRMTLATAVHGLFVCALFVSIGDWLFQIWYNGAVEPQRIEIIGAALYILFISIEASNFTYLSSTGFLDAASRAILLKAVCSAIAIVAVTFFDRSHLVFWVLLINNITFSLVPLSVITFSTLRSG